MSDDDFAKDPQDPRQGQGVELFVEGVHRWMMNPRGQSVVGWRGVAGAENGRAFCNAGGGFALLWVVHRKPGPDGQLTRLYEQPCIVENPGAIVVALDDRGRIGLVQNFRGVRGPRLKGVPVSNYVRTVDEQNRWGELVKTLGQWTWECPRGLAPPEKVASSDEDGGEALKRHVLKVARLEAAEEAGFELKNPRIVGSMNINTTFFAHDQMVVRAQLARIGKTEHEDLEQIGAVRFFSLEELGAMRDAGEFTDGITLAALAMCGLALPLPSDK